MGDSRFQAPLDRVKSASDRAASLRTMATPDVIAALAASSREKEPLLANVIATEALNRVGRDEAALECLGEGVYTLDADGRIVHINRAGAGLLQQGAEDILWKYAADAIDLQDPMIDDGHGTRPDEFVLRTGRSLSSEHGLLRRGGDDQLRLVGYSAAPVLREGEFAGAVVAFRDITERRRAEEAISRHGAQLEHLLDAIPDAILVTDMAGRVRYANPAAQDLFGRAVTDLVDAYIGVPSVSATGAQVDVSGAGGRWTAAFQRNIPFEWEGTPGVVSMYRKLPREAA